MFVLLYDCHNGGGDDDDDDDDEGGDGDGDGVANRSLELAQRNNQIEYLEIV